MGNAANQELGNKWLSVPIIATITRLLCRVLTLQNEYRLHQGIGNRVPVEHNMIHQQQGGHMPLKIRVRNVIRKDFLGGLLKSYQKAA